MRGLVPARRIHIIFLILLFIKVMPIVIENIDRYILHFKGNNLIIEDKLLHPKDLKKMDEENERNKKKNVALEVLKNC